MASKLHPRIVISVLVLASALPLLAQTRLIDKWLGGLKETDQYLRTQQWEKAAKRGRQAGADIVDHAGTGASPAYSLAVAAVFRAIAEAGLGHQDDAEWLWDSALNLFPDVAKTSLEPYGPAAAELRKRTLRPVGLDNDPGLRLVGKAGEVVVNPSGKNIEHPRIVHQTKPEYPTALRLLEAGGAVVVSSIIGTDGRPRQPVVLDAKGGGPALRYVALDTLRQWRFEPAKLDGKPVAVFYVLTVNFKVSK
jgi:TonB family protein